MKNELSNLKLISKKQQLFLGLVSIPRLEIFESVDETAVGRAHLSVDTCGTERALAMTAAFSDVSSSHIFSGSA